MPQCYIALWHEIVWPKVLKQYGGDINKGSILDKKVTTTNSELEQWRKFGPAWSWMTLSKAAREQEWEIEANG